MKEDGPETVGYHAEEVSQVRFLAPGLHVGCGVVATRLNPGRHNMPILFTCLIVDDGDGPERIGYLHAETPVGVHTPVSLVQTMSDN